MAQMVDHQPGKCKALYSIPSTTTNNNNKKEYVKNFHTVQISDSKADFLDQLPSN
jgi:hypothetical protein